MSVHTIAAIKGTVEGDPFLHFGALGAFDTHAEPAVTLGLIERSGTTFTATDAGRAFYVDANLASLPSGRANQWGSAADRAIALLDALGAEGEDS